MKIYIFTAINASDEGFSETYLATIIKACKDKASLKEEIKNIFEDGITHEGYGKVPEKLLLTTKHGEFGYLDDPEVSNRSLDDYIDSDQFEFFDIMVHADPNDSPDDPQSDVLCKMAIEAIEI